MPYREVKPKRYREKRDTRETPFLRGALQGATGMARLPAVVGDVAMSLAAGRPLNALAQGMTRLGVPEIPSPEQMTPQERRLEAAGRGTVGFTGGPLSGVLSMGAEVAGSEVAEATGSELAGAGTAFFSELLPSVLLRRPVGRWASRSKLGGALSPRAAAARRLDELGGTLGDQRADDAVAALVRRQDDLVEARKAAYGEYDEAVARLGDRTPRPTPEISSETALELADQAVAQVPMAQRNIGAISARPFVARARELVAELVDNPEDIPPIAKRWAEMDPGTTVTLPELAKMLRATSRTIRKSSDSSEAAAKAFHAGQLQDELREMLDSIPFDYDAAGEVIDVDAWNAVEALKRARAASAAEHRTFAGPIERYALRETGYNPQMAMAKIMSRGRKESVEAARTMVRELSGDPTAMAGLRRAAMERVFEGRLGAGIEEGAEILSARGAKSARDRLNQNREILDEILGSDRVEQIRRALTMSANDKPSRGIRGILHMMGRGGGAAGAGAAMTGDLATAGGLHVGGRLLEHASHYMSPRYWQELAFAGLFDADLADRLTRRVDPRSVQNWLGRALATAIRRGYVSEQAWQEFQQAEPFETQVAGVPNG